MDVEERHHQTKHQYRQTEEQSQPTKLIIHAHQLPLNQPHKFMFPNHTNNNTRNSTTMPSPRNSYASSAYSYSTTSTTDTIKDAKASSSKAAKTPSPKKDSFLQKTKKVLAGPSPEEEAERKAKRSPEQAMMEKYGAGRGNIMGPH